MQKIFLPKKKKERNVKRKLTFISLRHIVLLIGFVLFSKKKKKINRFNDIVEKWIFFFVSFLFCFCFLLLSKKIIFGCRKMTILHSIERYFQIKVCKMTLVKMMWSIFLLLFFSSKYTNLENMIRDNWSCLYSLRRKNEMNFDILKKIQLNFASHIFFYYCWCLVIILATCFVP